MYFVSLRGVLCVEHGKSLVRLLEIFAIYSKHHFEAFYFLFKQKTNPLDTVDASQGKFTILQI